jgi:hypothetical protein
MSAVVKQTRGQTRPEAENGAFSSYSLSVAMVVSIEAEVCGWPGGSPAFFTMGLFEIFSRRRDSIPGARVSILDARTSTRFRFDRRGLINHGGEQFSQATPSRTVAHCQLGHFGEAQLWVGKRQATQGLRGRRNQVIELVLVAHLYGALLEQLKLAVKRPQADPELR